MYSLIKGSSTSICCKQERQESKEEKGGHLDNVQRWWERGEWDGGNVESCALFIQLDPSENLGTRRDLSAQLLKA